MAPDLRVSAAASPITPRKNMRRCHDFIEGFFFFFVLHHRYTCTNRTIGRIWLCEYTVVYTHFGIEWHSMCRHGSFDTVTSSKIANWYFFLLLCHSLPFSAILCILLGKGYKSKSFTEIEFTLIWVVNKLTLSLHLPIGIYTKQWHACNTLDHQYLSIYYTQIHIQQPSIHMTIVPNTMRKVCGMISKQRGRCCSYSGSGIFRCEDLRIELLTDVDVITESAGSTFEYNRFLCSVRYLISVLCSRIHPILTSTHCIYIYIFIY